MNTRISLQITFWCVLFALGFSVVSTPLEVLSDVYLPQVAFLVRAIDEVVLLVGVFALVVGVRHMPWRAVMGDWIVRLSLGYGALHLVYLLWGGVDVAALMGVAIDTRFVIAGVLTYILVRWARCSMQWVWRVAIVSMIIVIGFGALQWVLPKDSLAVLGYSEETVKPYDTIDSNEAMVRHQSFLRGPNPLGAYSIIVVALLASMWKSMWKNQRFLWISCMALSLFVLYGSHSRGAWLGAFVALAIVAVMSYGHVVRRIAPWLAILGVVAMMTVVMFRDTSFVSQVILHENPANGRSVNSNDQHVQSLAEGFERMVRQPFGAGVGTTGTPSLATDAPLIIENHYFYVAHEVGWIGVGLFLALFGYSMWQLWKCRCWALLGAGAGLAVVALFLPVWADEAVAVTWWVLACGVIATKKGEKHATN